MGIFGEGLQNIKKSFGMDSDKSEIDVYAGIDTANSFLKYAIRDRNQIIHEGFYLNTLRKLDYAEYDPGFEDENLKNGAIDPKEAIFRFDTHTYYRVGSSIKSESSSMIDESRYLSENYLLETLSPIASKVQKEKERVCLVLGLPSEHQMNVELKKQLVERFLGGYELYVNNIKKTFEIVRVYVLSQPLGAYTGLTWNSQLQARNIQLKEGLGLLLDIGWGSSDGLVIEDGKEIRQFDIGKSMVNAYEELHKEIMRTYPVFTSRKLNLLDIEKEARTHNYFSYGADTYQIGELKDRTFSYVAESIIANTKAQLKPIGIDWDRFKHISIVGGGAEALGKYIPKYLDGKRCKKPEHAQGQTAMGFLLYGMLKNRKKK